MKQTLLILSYHQFGYLTDTVKYCENINDLFEITYVGWDYGMKEVKIDGVEVKYVSRRGNIIIRNLRLLIAFNNAIKEKPKSKVFVHYTRGVSLVRLLNLKSIFILDIRTLAVGSSALKRNSYNLFLKFETFFFKNISLISKGIAEQLHIRKYTYLPLGADLNFNKERKHEGTFNLLYVGTLQGRDIIKCVIGLEEYIKKTNNQRIKLKIIGDGVEIAEIRKYVDNSDYIKNRVVCTGRIPHNELKIYYEWADVGISFVPITSWFNNQPPTKTFEYLLAGLPVIATKTKENENVIKGDELSILIQDTIEDFSNALAIMEKKLGQPIAPGYFKERYGKWSWKEIVKNNFLPLILNAK